MEFGCGRGDDPYEEGEEEEEEENSSNKHMLSMTSTCSSSSSFHLHPWQPQPPPPSSSTPSSSNAEGRPAVVAAAEKEHMFDKMVTPSDVGKLNRLVIPKQHAERYFPLDPSAGEKGLLLGFEDRTGKQWQFRYSYWKSSQSYVMTKGWSRFVKEKRLDAGDTVSFYRGLGESARDRHFVDWKRKPPAIHDPSRLLLLQRPRSVTFPMVSFSRSPGPWAGRLVLPTPPPAAATTATAAAATSYDPHQRYSFGYSNVASGSSAAAGVQYLVFRSAAETAPPVAAQAPIRADATLAMPMVLDSLPVVPSQQQTTARRVRLFGVNLDFQEPHRQHPYQRPSPLQLQQQQQQQPQQAFSSSSSSPSSTANEQQQQQQSLDLDL